MRVCVCVLEIDRTKFFASSDEISQRWIRRILPRRRVRPETIYKMTTAVYREASAQEMEAPGQFIIITITIYGCFLFAPFSRARQSSKAEPTVSGATVDGASAEKRYIRREKIQFSIPRSPPVDVAYSLLLSFASFFPSFFLYFHSIVVTPLSCCGVSPGYETHKVERRSITFFMAHSRPVYSFFCCCWCC